MLLAEIDPGNIASEKVIAKLGFRPNESFVTGDEIADLNDGRKMLRDEILWYLARSSKTAT